jgi:hypothetical protein
MKDLGISDTVDVLPAKPYVCIGYHQNLDQEAS